MKATALYVAFFALALLAIPMIALSFDLVETPEVQAQVHTPGVPAQQSAQPPDRQPSSGAAAEPNEQTAGSAEPLEETAAPAIPPAAHGVAEFAVLDETTGEVVSVPLRDFVRGAVAAEMPANFHLEALKAQAVAAHTFALHNHLVQQQTPDPALQGADFSADPQHFKVYVTEEMAQEFYGEQASTAWSKICEAADSVLPYVLEYEQEPIVAAYHAISAGQTEDAANVWSGSAPYLQPADSEGDLLAPEYESIVTVPAEEVRALLLQAYPEITLPEDPEDWFGGDVRSASGYITEIRVGDQVLHGKEIRQLLDLRSHNFEMEYTDAGFVFYVYGYGHGVGLSQYGADFLARQGKTYDEILANYYTGAELHRVELPGFDPAN